MSDADLHEALLQAVCDEPNVPLHKLALADYFGERGDELRQAAWIASQRLIPAPEGMPTATFWWYGNHNWHGVYPKASYVERGWLEAAPQGIGNWQTCREYDDIAQAYRAIIEGFVRWKGGTA
jgi:uncharacterized protein (TIGR02996 family)